MARSFLSTPWLLRANLTFSYHSRPLPFESSLHSRFLWPRNCTCLLRAGPVEGEMHNQGKQRTLDRLTRESRHLRRKSLRRCLTSFLMIPAMAKTFLMGLRAFPSPDSKEWVSVEGAPLPGVSPGIVTHEPHPESGKLVRGSDVQITSMHLRSQCHHCWKWPALSSPGLLSSPPKTDWSITSIWERGRNASIWGKLVKTDGRVQRRAADLKFGKTRI